VIGSINRLRFHHNYFDNFNDDGLYLTSDQAAGADVRITQLVAVPDHAGYSDKRRGQGEGGVRLRKCSTCGRHPEPDRDHAVADRRRPRLPDLEADAVLPQHGAAAEGRGGNYYAAGLGSATRGSVATASTRLRVRPRHPGFAFDTQGDVLADGNLHGSPELTGKAAAANLGVGPASAEEEAAGLVRAEQEDVPAGWTANDVIADPKFARLDADGLE